MNRWLSLIIMCGTVYLIRLLPLLFLRREIKNRFIRSFLHYVPYVTLAVMTFPAILSAAENPLCGLFALAIGIIVALWKEDLFLVALSCVAAMLLGGLVL
ncbi:MAG: AzlD domain-containing protein [Lachnospiraceae bacterium]|nr:AzlD domain-containing protein [Lachnospiraceae bacterium]